jgi:hypothetical protein
MMHLSGELLLMRYWEIGLFHADLWGVSGNEQKSRRFGKN